MYLVIDNVVIVKPLHQIVQFVTFIEILNLLVHVQADIMMMDIVLIVKNVSLYVVYVLMLQHVLHVYLMKKVDKLLLKVVDV